MARLEDINPGMSITGIPPNQNVAVVDVKWHGSNAIELFYKRPDGQPGTQLLFRRDETDLDFVTTGRKWSSDQAPTRLRRKHGAHDQREQPHAKSENYEFEEA